MSRHFRHVSAAAFALCVASGFATTARAQATCGATGAIPNCAPAGTQVSTTVQRIIYISITNPAFTLTAPDNTDFTGGGTTQKADLAAQVATIRSNAAWTFTVQGAAWTGTGNNGKLVADLAWTINGGALWTAMTTGAVSVTTGAVTAGSGVTIGYRTDWSLTSDTPGTYTMALIYTLSAP